MLLLIQPAQSPLFSFMDVIKSLGKICDVSSTRKVKWCRRQSNCTAKNTVLYIPLGRSSFYWICCCFFGPLFMHKMVNNLISSATLWSEMNRTKVSHKILLMKSSENHFIFLLVFYLIMWVMKASKNFGKIAILKILELISLWDVKTYFGKLALKWCIFRHEKRIF